VGGKPRRASRRVRPVVAMCCIGWSSRGRICRARGSRGVRAELRCRVARNRLYTCVSYICSCGTSVYRVWARRPVEACDNVQARRPVAEVRAHDDSEVRSRAGAVSLSRKDRQGKQRSSRSQWRRKRRRLLGQLSAIPRNNSISIIS